jgi:hypothetical protein
MGISRGAVISLILKYIGGTPILPSLKIITEGTPPLKQIGLNSLTSVGGLGALSSALGGTALSSLTSGVFQNPLSDISSTTLSSLTNGISNLNNLSGTIDAGQLSNLTGLYSQLGDATNSLKTLTDNISGVSLPNFEVNGSAFGLNEVTGVIKSYDGISQGISDKLNSQFGDIRNTINENVANVIAPLDFNSRLTEIKADILNIENNLISQAGQAGFDDYYATAVTQLTAYRNEINEKHDTSISSMLKLNNGLEIGNTLGQTGDIYKNGTDTTKTLLDKVVQPATLANIKIDLNIV